MGFTYIKIAESEDARVIREFGQLLDAGETCMDMVRFFYIL